MSGEVRLVRSPIVWGSVSVVPCAAIAWLVRGADAAASIVIAVALVLANAGLAATMAALATRLGPTGPAMIAIPSFTTRMAGMFAALALLRAAAFVDKPTFALAFGVAVTGVLVGEARAWKRTPWLALAFTKTRSAETVEETA